MILVGVIAAILLALGLLPPYFEIWKRRGRVIGISERLLAIGFDQELIDTRLCVPEFGLVRSVLFLDGSWYVYRHR